MVAIHTCLLGNRQSLSNGTSNELTIRLESCLFAEQADEECTNPSGIPYGDVST